MAFGWWRRRPRGLDAWHAAWAEAAEDPSDADIAPLTAALDALGLPEDEVEVERERLEGLAAAVAFRASLAAGLPVVETGHRIVGSDRCHFIAAASRVDDPSQPAGRLLLTDRRVLFAGGAATVALPWHAVTGIALDGRDLALAARTGAPRAFRCNSYADALCARLIATRLTPASAGRPL